MKDAASHTRKLKQNKETSCFGCEVRKRYTHREMAISDSHL